MQISLNSKENQGSNTVRVYKNAIKSEMPLATNHSNRLFICTYSLPAVMQIPTASRIF